MGYIKDLKDISINDVALFGGKNASLGEMISTLSDQGIVVPHGFALSTKAFKDHVAQENINEKIAALLQSVDQKKPSSALKIVSKKIRKLIELLLFLPQLEKEIIQYYRGLSHFYHVKQCPVAVRSSASAEDLPTASFAGQHESFLGITTLEELFDAIKKCMSSLFTERAIIYRAKQGFESNAVFMSVGVQKMVMASAACSGVSFSIDTETGFNKVIMIESVYGLGESIVQGISTPDLFVVHKTLLENNVNNPIIRKECGGKESIIYLKHGKITSKKTSKRIAHTYTLSDENIISLAQMVLKIEQHYSKKNFVYTPMDVEWAKDSMDGRIYIIQARPETITQGKGTATYELYKLNSIKQPILKGESIGRSIVSGTVLCVTDIKKMPKKIPRHCILVAPMTTPDLIVAVPTVSGIITERGGRTCHAAIISREMKIPAIVGVSNALKKLKTGDTVTIDCSQGNEGFVYLGAPPFSKEEYQLPKKVLVEIPLMVTIASASNIFSIAQLPVAGIGLLRVEFVIARTIGIHPLAALFPDRIDKETRKQIAKKHTILYKDAKTFFMNTLRQNLASIAASFYPRPVIIRLSDFKSNEYRDLLGGSFFEPVEENPMLGFRGASRYLDHDYFQAFSMELEILSYLIKEMGLSNIILLVPFVRTVAEGEKVVAIIKQQKVLQKVPIYMMVEIPANCIELSHHAQYFDGFSIGSNDLFQLFFGVDRDEPRKIVNTDERNSSFLALLHNVVEEAKKIKKPIGICGQAPSDFPEVAEFLMNSGISSISLNADSVLPFLLKKVKNR